MRTTVSLLGMHPNDKLPARTALYSPSLIGLIVAWIGLQVLIFLLSHQDGHDSGGLSAKLLAWLQHIGLVPEGAIDQRTASFILRKLAHFTEFGMLSWLSARIAVRLRPTGWIVPATVYSILYACSDELHQAFIPGRGPAITDVLVDSAGICAAICAYALYLRHAGKNRP